MNMYKRLNTLHTNDNADTFTGIKTITLIGISKLCLAKVKDTSK